MMTLQLRTAIIPAAVFLFISFVTRNASAAEAKRAPIKVRLEGEGSGIFFDRSRNFRMANTGNWADRTAGRNGNEQRLVYDTDGWGGAYGIEAAGPEINRFSVELSFDQSFYSNRLIKSNLPGRGGQLLTTMAFIDGAEHGRSGFFGFFVSSNPAAGVNSPGEAILKHEFDSQSFSVNIVYSVIRGRRFNFDFFGGPEYTHFSQDYRLSTTGASVVAGRTTSQTNEELRDHLAGGQIGIRKKISLWNRFHVSARETFGSYLRYSRFWGVQNLENASGIDITLIPFGSLTERISTRDRDVEFSPRFDTEISLGFQLKRVSIDFFYRFAAWFKMSRIENSVVAADLRSLLSGKTSIQEETLRSHAIGGKITVAF